MSGPVSTYDAGNHRYQRDLAAVLVADLGFDGALETCRENGWEGALRALLASRTAPAPRAGRRRRSGAVRDDALALGPAAREPVTARTA